MQCPTVAVFAGLKALADDEDGTDPRLESVSPMLKQMWRQPGYLSYAGVAGSLVPHKLDLVRRMHGHGVPLMIGTDLGNPYVFPGISVHEEMRRFADAGIPIADVLRMATIVPARFCGAGDRLGTVEAGKTASLLLLRAIPLESIANAAEIETVILGGRVFGRARLDRLAAGERDG